MTDGEADGQTGGWRRPKAAPCSMVQSPLVDYMWGIDDTRSASRDRRLHAAARALCGVCPLKDRCLALAVVQRMKNAGIMGGLNDTERRYIAHLAQSLGVEVTTGRGRWLLTDGERRALMSNFMQWLQAHPDAIETCRKMAHPHQGAPQTPRGLPGRPGGRIAAGALRRLKQISTRKKGNIMPTITFANNKGGVAKTTSTIMTGLALRRRGLKVEVRDLDPSGDATEWAQAASRAGADVSIEVTPANMRNVDAQSDPDTWVLIDTLPEQMQIVQAGIDAADLAILVTSPGRHDTDHLIEMAECIDRPLTVLVTLARPGTIALRNAVDKLKATDLMGFSTIIPNRQATLRASGTNVLPAMSGYQEAATELVEAF